jgi:ribonuclease HI
MIRKPEGSPKKNKAVIYTDGACSGNPGKGGYGVVVMNANDRIELSGGYRRTTNNRMELMAAIAGLEALKEPSEVTLYSDSRYLVDANNLGWARSWKARGWRRSTKEKALNVDLWARLLNLNEIHNVTYVWVEGHAGVKENERCDFLSVQASREANLPIDSGYEGEAKKETRKPAQGSLF